MPRYKKYLMWASIPYLNDDHDPLETDVKIRLRVATPYSEKYASFNENTTNPNDSVGMYSFSTVGFDAETNKKEVAEDALEMIRVVPNPYYGHSYYQSSSTDRRVRITNLPEKCNLVIYSLEGTIIKEFNKNNSSQYLDWDLRNSSGKKVSGGMYIFHINVPDIGEKIIKWFGAMSEN